MCHRTAYSQLFIIGGMCDKMIVVLVVAALFASSHAQVPGSGRCPPMGIMNDFNATAFMGKWYEAEKYFAFYETLGRCITATFSQSGSGFSVLHKEISILNGLDNSGSLNIRKVGSPTDGQFQLMISIPQFPFPIPAPFTIVETDYKSFAVVSSCIDLVFFHLKFAWVLTRERFPATLAQAYAVMDDRDMDRDILIKTEHYLCPVDH